MDYRQRAQTSERDHERDVSKTRSADKRWRGASMAMFASRQESRRLLDFSVMAVWLQISGLVLFLALWGMAWRRQPNLALGIFLGVAIAALVAALVRPSQLHSVPVWLPPLPFAAVATSLFGFGIWAWILGRKR
jgi:hypothetical protein